MEERNESAGAVIITTRELYDEIVGLRGDVRDLTNATTNVTKAIDDHEQRLRTIERWKYALPTTTAAAVVSAVVTLVGKTKGV